MCIRDREDAARKAVALSKGEPVPADMIDIDMPRAELEALIERETSKMAPPQKYYRGFFSGGTLADEDVYKRQQHLYYSIEGLSIQFLLIDFDILPKTCLLYTSRGSFPWTFAGLRS